MTWDGKERRAVDHQQDLKMERMLTKLEQVHDDTRDIKKTLFGPDGRNGMVKDINDMKTGIYIFRWIAGTGFFAGVTAMLKSLWPGN